MSSSMTRPSTRRAGARPFRVSSTVAPSVSISQLNSGRSDMFGYEPFPRFDTSTSGRSSTPPSLHNFDVSSSPAYRSIPGFPLHDNDDTRSIMSVPASVAPYKVAKLLRALTPTEVCYLFRLCWEATTDRAQGQGLSKDYWMPDESARACFNCESVFTTFRRRHHCECRLRLLI